MTIKIDALKVFLTVSETQSLLEASRKLGRTMSAISMSLKQFEDEIGAPLFESSRKSKLTEMGSQIYKIAHMEVAHFEASIDKIERLAKGSSGKVSLAVTPSFANSILPQIIKDFISINPDVELEVRDMSSSEIVIDVESHRSDIGISSLPATNGLENLKFCSDQFGVICRADHPKLKAKSEVVWGDLKEFNFIGNGLCDLIHDAEFTQILNQSKIFVPNTGSLIGLVQAGVGVSVMPELIVENLSEDIRFIPISGTKARRDVFIITKNYNILSPVVQSFVDKIKAFEFMELNGIQKY